MSSAGPGLTMVFAGLLLGAAVQGSGTVDSTGAAYFEGRWAFTEESCDQSTNWTLIAGGSFVSEDLTGAWQWADGRLKLSLIDLAIDEETGEAGGRFQMEGPVMIVDSNQFNFTIEPDIYVMKRCS